MNNCCAENLRPMTSSDGAVCMVCGYTVSGHVIDSKEFAKIAREYNSMPQAYNHSYVKFGGCDVYAYDKLRDDEAYMFEYVADTNAIICKGSLTGNAFGVVNNLLESSKGYAAALKKSSMKLEISEEQRFCPHCNMPTSDGSEGKYCGSCGWPKMVVAKKEEAKANPPDDICDKAHFDLCFLEDTFYDLEIRRREMPHEVYLLIEKALEYLDKSIEKVKEMSEY
jgi:hypothetical protein